MSFGYSEGHSHEITTCSLNVQGGKLCANFLAPPSAFVQSPGHLQGATTQRKSVGIHPFLMISKCCFQKLLIMLRENCCSPLPQCGHPCRWPVDHMEATVRTMCLCLHSLPTCTLSHMYCEHVGAVLYIRVSYLKSSHFSSIISGIASLITDSQWQSFSHLLRFPHCPLVQEILIKMEILNTCFELLLSIGIFAKKCCHLLAFLSLCVTYSLHILIWQWAWWLEIFFCS